MPQRRIAHQVTLVNALTLSRVILSGFFVYFLLLPGRKLLAITLLFTAIGISDFFDGRLARRLSACSRYGAVLDVGADFIFIMSAEITLVLLGEFPIWMAAVTVWKFIEFCYTSVLHQRLKGVRDAVFLFDPLGKITAVALYLLPFAAVLTGYFLPAGIYLPAVFGVCCLISLAALTSSFGRIRQLILL